MIGQMNIFDFLKDDLSRTNQEQILKVGDKIGRVVLGECRIATITKVEGMPDYPFYRTESGGCYTFEEGREEIEELVKRAEAERMKYRTIEPENLIDRITVQYEPRRCDGAVLWAQIGIFENMLFWKEDMTYQFLVPFDSDKKLKKEYEKHRKEILDDKYCKVYVQEKEHPMRRLYWSQHGFYSDAEYVKSNG